MPDQNSVPNQLSEVEKQLKRIADSVEKARVDRAIAEQCALDCLDKMIGTMAEVEKRLKELVK